MNDITLRARPALDRACKSRCSTLGQNPTWSCWSCLRHCNCSGWVQKKEKKERRTTKKKPKFTTSKILHDLSFEIVASSSPSLLGAIHWKESERTANLRFIFSTRKEKSTNPSGIWSASWTPLNSFPSARTSGAHPRWQWSQRHFCSERTTPVSISNPSQKPMTR